jgi:hypothetical protein
MKALLKELDINKNIRILKMDIEGAALKIRVAPFLGF